MGADAGDAALISETDEGSGVIVPARRAGGWEWERCCDETEGRVGGIFTKKEDAGEGEGVVVVEWQWVDVDDVSAAQGHVDVLDAFVKS